MTAPADLAEWAAARGQAGGFETLRVVQDDTIGYLGVIAIHSTARGPALGGTRCLHYPGPEAAVEDALRLAAGMTAKTAAADLPFGGGKSVIALPDGPHDRAALFRAHAQAVNALDGRYRAAPDVGTGPGDLRTMRDVSAWVLGLEGESARSGHWTAMGVLHAMRAALAHRTGRPGVGGRTVAIQGTGSVGAALARALVAAGARVVLADADEPAAAALARELGGGTVAPGAIHRVAADVFAPCALGGVLDARLVEELVPRIVAGGANNQLATPADARHLHARGILWVPDFVANAGGVITGAAEVLGWDAAQVAERVAGIERTVGVLLAEARDELPSAAAQRLVNSRLGGLA